MNIVRELIFFIEASTQLVAGTDLYQGVLKRGVDEGITFTQVGGLETDSNMMQVIVSCVSFYRDYDTAHDKLKDVYDLLAYSNGIHTDNVEIFNSSPLKTLGLVTHTDQGDFIFSFSVVLNYERQ